MYMKLSPKMEPRLSPNLVMASRLLQLSGVGLEHLIYSELFDNPALELVNESEYSPLEFAAHDYLNRPTSWWSDSEIQDAVERVAGWPSAIDQLEAQVRLMSSGVELDVAVYLLHFLDERGYLSADIEELADSVGVSVEVIEQGLRLLHQLDPPGIGARDLRECLLVQCNDLESEGIDCQLVRWILADCWEDFIHHRWGRVARRVNLSEGAVEATWQFVARNLYPHPLMLVAITSVGQEAFLRPDLIIRRVLQDDQPIYQLEIPAAEAWELKISDCFAAAVGHLPSEDPSWGDADKVWTRSYLECARTFINALTYRWDTLRRIGEYLIENQLDFLKSGPSRLRPLRQATVAQDLGLHESTVSRAVSDKYVQLPGGSVMALGDFFDPSLPAKEAIRHLLHRSNKPLSDREIVEHLRDEGISLARRTVSKYRQQLNFGNSYSRKFESGFRSEQGGQGSDEYHGRVLTGLDSYLLSQR
jgi:RNA polymerase sigma-54 factor